MGIGGNVVLSRGGGAGGGSFRGMSALVVSKGSLKGPSMAVLASL